MSRPEAGTPFSDASEVVCSLTAARGEGEQTRVPGVYGTGGVGDGKTQHNTTHVPQFVLPRPDKAADSRPNEEQVFALTRLGIRKTPVSHGSAAVSPWNCRLLTRPVRSLLQGWMARAAHNPGTKNNKKIQGRLSCFFSHKALDNEAQTQEAQGQGTAPLWSSGRSAVRSAWLQQRPQARPKSVQLGFFP